MGITHRDRSEAVPSGAPRLGSIVLFAIVAVTYLVGAEVGRWLSVEPGHFSTFWPNSGLYLALLLRTPPRRWWVVVAAAAAANLTSDVLLHNQRPAVALGFVLANTVEAVVGAVVVRRWLGGAARLDGLRSVLVVFLVAAAVSTPLGSLVGAATVSSAFGVSLPAAWQVWWVADALGVLLTVPLVLSLLDMRAWPRPAQLLEGATLLAGLVVAGTFVFTSIPHIAPIVLLLFLLWAAIRLDVPGVALAAFVLAMVAVRHTILGHGIFTETGDISQRIVSVQLFVAVPAFVFYAFAVVLAERRRIEAGLEEKVRERTAALLAQRELLSVTLTSIGDAVITTDTAGRVVQLNPVAEALTGWATAEAAGQPLDVVFHIVNETSRQPVDNPASRALQTGNIVGLANHTILIAKDGTERPIEDSAAPIRNKEGQIVGCVLVFRDVSEQRRAEKKRQQAAAILSSLVASAPVGIVLLDSDRRYRHINEPLAEMNGLPVEAHLGKTVAEVVPDLDDQVKKVFDRVLLKGETVPDFIIEGETPKAPGVKRAWRQSWFPICGVDGKPTGVGAIIQEITEQRRLEQERENSQRTLSALVERCPFGIYIVDDEFRIASVNAGSQDKAFANVRPLIGRPFDEAMRIIWPEPVATECINIFRRTLATGEPCRSTDFVNPRADIGRIEGYEWELHRITLPSGRHGVVCYYFDATKLRQAEAALRDSEAHFRSMADNAPAMLWVTDPTGACTFISRQWCEFTGTPVERNLGLGWLECVHPDDLPQVQADYVSANQRQQPFRIDYRLRRHDGAYRWAVDAAIPRFDGGVFGGYVGCVFDVHDLRMSEESLREADRKKDEFLATLAHELRNPLAPLRNGLQAMKLAQQDPEAIEQARTMMERQLGQMVHLIDDLMDLSRVSRGKIQLRKDRVELARVVQQAIETSRPLIEERGHTFTLDVPKEPLYVDADTTRLAQVFANLLNNAAKYTDRGGRIALSLARRDGHAVVSVRDNGVGIPAPMLPKVFDIFTQVDRSLEKAQGGLGIGLSLVKQLVEMHGGSVEARSAGHGLGSEFVVTLPPAPPPARQSRATDKSAPASTSARRRILVADDNADAATSLAMLLRLMGNEVRTAHDGAAAVEAAEAFRPDVALLDIGMPKLNGLEACRRIRQEPWGQGMILVALTGWGQEDDRRQTREAGFNHHVVKPVDPAKLQQLLAGLTAPTA